MAKIEVSVPHALPQAEALDRVKGLLANLQQEDPDVAKDLVESWDGNKGCFCFTARGFKVSGIILVENSDVHVYGEGPREIVMFKGKMEDKIFSQLERLLATTPAPAVGDGTDVGHEAKASGGDKMADEAKKDPADVGNIPLAGGTSPAPSGDSDVAGAKPAASAEAVANKPLVAALKAQAAKDTAAEAEIAKRASESFAAFVAVSVPAAPAKVDGGGDFEVAEAIQAAGSSPAVPEVSALQKGKSGEFFTFDEACARLHIEETKLKWLVYSGEIRAFREGDQMRFRKSDVDNLDLTGARSEEETGVIDLSAGKKGDSETLTDDLIFDEGDDFDLTRAEAEEVARTPPAEKVSVEASAVPTKVVAPPVKLPEVVAPTPKSEPLKVEPESVSLKSEPSEVPPKPPETPKVTGAKKCSCGEHCHIIECKLDGTVAVKSGCADCDCRIVQQVVVLPVRERERVAETPPAEITTRTNVPLRKGVPLWPFVLMILFIAASAFGFTWLAIDSRNHSADRAIEIMNSGNAPAAVKIAEAPVVVEKDLALDDKAVELEKRVGAVENHTEVLAGDLNAHERRLGKLEKDDGRSAKRLASAAASSGSGSVKVEVVKTITPPSPPVQTVETQEVVRAFLRDCEARHMSDRAGSAEMIYVYQREMARYAEKLKVVGRGELRKAIVETTGDGRFADGVLDELGIK